MPVSANQTLSLDQLLEMAWRRRWTAVVAFVLPLAALLTAIATLPDIYSASATILVERQQVPEEFVRSTVTTSVDSRVQIITQTLLSRSQLTEIINQFGLYPELQGKFPIDEIVERMRSDIRIGFGDTREKERTTTATREEATAFTVAYLGRDARKVSLVANELANRYINEDLKMREQHAEGTAKFLETELEQQLRRKLEEQERKVAQFKEEHMGELPSQETANLSSLERLNSQLLASGEKEVQVREQITFLERQLAESGLSSESAGPGPDAIMIRLAELRRELAELRKQYTDKYPDVVRVTSEISRLEKELVSRPPGEGSGGDDGSGRVSGGGEMVPAATSSLNLGDSLRQARAELRVLQAEQRNLKAEIAKYQERVENAPKREQEFTSVRRDYDTLQQVYDSLLTRYQEAKLAQSLEQRQKGEQFRIRDYALVPETPTAPDRPRVLLVSLVFALALAGGAVFLRERLDTSFHSSDEVRASYAPPIIVTVHRIVTGADRRRARVHFLGAAASTVIAAGLIVVASYLLTRDNSWLVSLFA
jgi:polysaccharide chain length determinant protein (PEP-CTERM system associated)